MMFARDRHPLHRACQLSWPLAVMLLLLAFAGESLAAEQGLTAISVTTEADGSQTYSLSLQVLLIMTMLSMLPAALIMMTAFTRIIIVLAILRTALGTAQTPTNQILIGLALFLTIFIMAPVFEEVYETAVQPYMQEKLTPEQAIKVAAKPVRAFMLQQTRDSDLQLFVEISNTGAVEKPDDLPMSVLIPSFITSELKTAFQIGFLLFIPFLIIDLVVASVLMSMGMMMLSPLIISLPFKVMLFVLVDGWALVLGTLASSFYI